MWSTGSFISGAVVGIFALLFVEMVIFIYIADKWKGGKD